jgi:hypothetical protein
MKVNGRRKTIGVDENVYQFYKHESERGKNGKKIDFILVMLPLIGVSFC